ncbi:ATP-binding protein [Arachnia rubra]|jgi:probable DNA-binding protein|uniref:DNA binding domain-containing protein n=1 Tax=Arachnia rubra TaxID=1547448 RepID=A0ABX7Y7J6_9ACTN|nr:ATP-binding protein [Arachnia rubra]MBB1571173.1 putative DNA binding domain-containing protein [Propionibacterium sp.]MDO4645564.1 ATP-binding protein [Propionibacteriaceae bacterium]QUC08869.1 putative DNA binding domain-containing protein [Arachnia rubra]BCR80304.1 dihydroorotate dehydrogenase [Arachnia rubra]
MDEQSLQELVERLRLVGTDQQQVEVKSAVGKSVLETLSAFSNGAGGIVLIGLAEREGFSPVPGFDAVAQRDALLSRCAEMTPTVRPDVLLMPFEGNVVLVATVPEMLPRDKPCYVTARGRYQGSYLRTGDGDVKLQHYEIDRLVEEHAQPVWDEEPIPAARLEDLNTEALASYCAGQRQDRPRTFVQGDEVALRRLRIMRDAHPTLAALLALGEYPQEFFPRLTITFAVFPGATKGEIGTGTRLLDSATLNGSIPELVEEGVSLVRKNMRQGALLDEVYRRELPDYPLVAVREALVNALMHRDYSPMARGTQVQLNMYVDRLEVVSPGGLYGAVTLRTLGTAGVSSTRNQRLATLLEHVRFPGGGFVAENRGTGFAVIAAELEKALMPPAEVRDDLVSFTIIFRRRRMVQGKQRSTARSGIERALRERTSATTTELMEATGFSRTAVQKALNQLVAEGVIEALEPPRSPRRRYRVGRQ